MGILNGDEIRNVVSSGFLKNTKDECINAGSIDLHLSQDFWTLKGNETIDLTKGETPTLVKVSPKNDGLIHFTPGMCLLASTVEEFNFPNFLCAEVYLRSSVGRLFIEHMHAGWADAGFHGSNLTLEFVNMSTNTYKFKDEFRFVQLVLNRMDPVSQELNYRNKGNYNKKLGTIGSRGVK